MLSRYADGKLIMTSQANFARKSKNKTHPLGWVLFLAPRTGLEPVTSPIVSDSKICANIAGATRQAHSRLGRSSIRFRYSLLRAFDIKKTAIQAIFSRQLPTSQAPGRVLSRYADEI